MNNHIYSTLFKIQERESDRSSKEIEQRKESQNTQNKDEHVTLLRGGTGLIQVVGLYWKIIAYMEPLDPKLIRARLMVPEKVVELYMPSNSKSGGAKAPLAPLSVPPLLLH